MISKNVRKLLSRIECTFGILYFEPIFKSHRPGYWQKASGAWSWSIREGDTRALKEIGSSWTVLECIKATRIEEYNGPGGKEIIVENDK